MHPEMIPASPHATTTVIDPLAPPSNASQILENVRRWVGLISPTRIATPIDIVAEYAIVNVLVDTRYTSATSGARRYISLTSSLGFGSSSFGIPFMPIFFASRCTAMNMPVK